MDLVFRLYRDDLARLQLPVIVEMYDKIRERGSKQRRYHDEFTEAERKVISAYYKRIYRWYLVTGYPKYFTFGKLQTIELLKRAANFFGSL